MLTTPSCGTAARFGQLANAAVEGIGSYGYRLAQFLVGQGISKSVGPTGPAV